METPNQNNFETTAGIAEEKLDRVSCAMDEVMEDLPAEEYETIARKLIDEKVEEIRAFLKAVKYLGTKKMASDLSEMSKRTLKNFPQSLIPGLVRKLSLTGAWKDDFLTRVEIGMTFSVVLSSGKLNNGNRDEHMDEEVKGGITEYSFSELDFP